MLNLRDSILQMLSRHSLATLSMVARYAGCDPATAKSILRKECDTGHVVETKVVFGRDLPPKARQLIHVYKLARQINTQ